jgi:hypothetical protein
MNGAINDATVKRYFYATHDQLRTQLQNFVDADNFARRRKTLRGLTPSEFIRKASTSHPKQIQNQPAPANAGTKQLIYGTIRVPVPMIAFGGLTRTGAARGERRARGRER